MNFTTQYNKLNAAQKEAVNTIEGPVLVVAGPGTGKTQLLSMRAANILRQTDVAPQNILCLTFTESGATAMRKRLVSLMGTAGNDVAVHTFHNFGAEIINRFNEYFYNGAKFSPTDDLTQFEILQEIFESLPHSSPLAKTMNSEFTALKDARWAISNLKKAGLLPDELLKIIDHNQDFCDFAEAQIAAAFSARLAKKDLPVIQDLLLKLQSYAPKNIDVLNTTPLAQICLADLEKSLLQAQQSGKTTALTAWRNKWLEKNSLNQLVFKDRRQNKRLKALARVYKEYRQKLAEQQLFDFDDMISNVAHTLEQTPELKFNLQEQYLYVMVDEFQDTNGAQMRLLDALADNPANEGQPNILAVGDDDQAIYSFQGAELSNILEFSKRYKNTKIITLTENYRSTAEVLKHARQVITQGNERLETSLNINKTLNSNSNLKSTVQINTFINKESELEWVAKDVARLINSGEQPAEIAIIARNHKQLIDIVPFLHKKNIAINYEKRSDVLKNPAICELLTLVHVIVHLSDQRFDLAESHLPQVLSYEFWGLSPQEVWQLSLNSYKQSRLWLELMLESSGKLHQIAEFVIIASHYSQHLSLDAMLDLIIGSSELQAPEEDQDSNLPEKEAAVSEDFTSPYRAHYFNQQTLAKSPAKYLELLENLRSLRRALANWRPDADEPPKLEDLLDFVELHHRTKTPVLSNIHAVDANQSINLMSAHKAKGLEFSTVYILNAQDKVWGSSSPHQSASIKFPHNLPIEPAGATNDDALRLFFVAMTRAKQNLILTSHQFDDTGKELVQAKFLTDTAICTTNHPEKTQTDLSVLTPNWQEAYYNPPKQDQKTLLKPILENYKLSATHVNNFIDVTHGGPQAFLLQNLLRFPQANTKSLAFGMAIHSALQNAHAHLTATGQPKPIEDILRDYDLQLMQNRLSENDLEHLLEKGSDVLQNYLSKRYSQFNQNQKAERNFSNQNIIVDDIKITGAIDLIEINNTNKTIVLTDYKTGKGVGSWQGKTDYEKIKLHKYKQQLMFYKLLVENSTDYKNYQVERCELDFVEPDDAGELHKLSLQITTDEFNDFKRLIKVIWQKIQNLDLPKTDSYSPDYKGILKFEQDLLS